MKKIIFSLAIVGLVMAAAIGGTVAFFSDTETSTGNVFTAGAIDLGIGNTSYYNGSTSPNTTWARTNDLDDGVHLFFSFADLKPGDWGADVIELHVDNNEAWGCAEVSLTSDQENTITEPEGDLLDEGPDGELDSEVQWALWADDGDSVFEDHETLLLDIGTFADLGGLYATSSMPLADATVNIFGGDTGEGMTGDATYHLAKYWCFGDLVAVPVQNNQGSTPIEGLGSGFTCDGASVTNISQTDSLTASIGFTAIQTRHNPNYTCLSN